MTKQRKHLNTELRVPVSYDYNEFASPVRCGAVMVIEIGVGVVRIWYIYYKPSVHPVICVKSSMAVVEVSTGGTSNEVIPDR